MEWIRENLSWDRVLGIVGLVAGVLVGIFLGIERYSLAELCVGLSGVTLALWAIARPRRVLAILLLVLFIGSSGVTIYLIQDYKIGKEREKAEEVRYSGHIIPADEPGPELPSSVPPNSLQLLLGDDLRIILGKVDTSIIKYKGEPILSIVLKQGEMMLSTTISDSTNHDIVRIIDNEFQAFPEYSFNPRQQDDHSLMVRDVKGKEVFNVRFVNKNTIRIVGRLHVSGLVNPFIIHPSDGLVFPNGGGIARLTIVDLVGAGVFNFQ